MIDIHNSGPLRKNQKVQKVRRLRGTIGGFWSILGVKGSHVNHQWHLGQQRTAKKNFALGDKVITEVIFAVSFYRKCHAEPVYT